MEQNQEQEQRRVEVKEVQLKKAFEPEMRTSWKKKCTIQNDAVLGRCNTKEMQHQGDAIPRRCNTSGVHCRDGLTQGKNRTMRK